MIKKLEYDVQRAPPKHDMSFSLIFYLKNSVEAKYTYK